LLHIKTIFLKRHYAVINQSNHIETIHMYFNI